jgi:alkylhydroperoxidase/carboxymuconolactone decarboxylase family protein YurZ
VTEASLENDYPNFSPGLDWSPNLSLEDVEQVASNYATYTAPERFEVAEPVPPPRGAEQFRFVSLMFDARPELLKRYRLWTNAQLRGADLEHPLPTTSPIFTIVSGHYYITEGYDEGIVADILALRARAARKAEVAHMLALGWFHGGNIGINRTARLADAYMRAWDPDDGAAGLTWPDGWAADPDVFRCGIDFERGEPLRPNELAAIENWHRRWEGEVPAYVGFLAKYFPTALRAYRARFETAMDGALPSQMVALVQIDVAAKWRRAEAVRRALHLAKKLGITRDQAVQMVAYAQRYVGHTGMDAAVRGSERSFASWG